MENMIDGKFNLNSIKASIVECARVAGASEGELKQSDFDSWENDYNKSWQVRFMYDLQCLQKAMQLIDDALMQKDLVTVDDALRDAVIRTSSIASTFEYITSDLMHLRHLLKNASIVTKSAH